jgi:toluene monooxygenase system ferredoxin subunit
MAFEKVTTLDDLWQGEMKGVAVRGLKVLLVHVDGVVRAYEDKCVHQEVALSEGRLDGCAIVCRAHLWRFDAKTGLGINPEGTQLRPIPVRLEGEDVLVDVAPRRPRDPAPTGRT